MSLTSTAINLPSASKWRRFMGMAYEFILCLPLYMGFVFVFSLLTGWSNESDQAHRIAAQVGTLLLFAGYFAWCWSGGRTTLPMATLQMTVVDAKTNQAIDFQRALLRFLFAMLSVGSVLGVLWAVVDRDGQSAHDRWARTRLVYAPKVKART